MISQTVSHICVDEDGVAWIDDTNVKVVEETADTRYLVLPAAPSQAGEIVMEGPSRATGGTN